jgi:hypothetical protein
LSGRVKHHYANRSWYEIERRQETSSVANSPVKRRTAGRRVTGPAGHYADSLFGVP